MSENTYRIWCLVEGDNTLFVVITSPMLFISELKDLIKEMRKHAVLSSIDAKDLTLWKARMTCSRFVLTLRVAPL